MLYSSMRTPHQCNEHGGVAERSIAPSLKLGGRLARLVGSIPTPSAIQYRYRRQKGRLPCTFRPTGTAAAATVPSSSVSSFSNSRVTSS